MVFKLTLHKHVKSLSSVFLASVLVLGSIAPTALAEEQTSAAKEAQQVKVLNPETASVFLDKFFNSPEAMAQYVGASVVIVKDGEVVAQEGYGYSDLAAQTQVDPEETAFRVASVSKTFNAVAAMQLVEQGKIDLKADIKQYIKGLEFDNPYDKPVTIEHLLTHTTGFEIRDPQQEDIHTDFDKTVSIEDYVREHMPPVVREPGSSYMYDNFASLLLGLVVQEVSGQPYEEYMQAHIFEPLGMKNSSFLLTDRFKEQLATGYDAAKNPVDLYAISPNPMPHGGMLTTAEDISQFMIAFLNGGTNGENRILSESTVDSMEIYRSAIHPLLPDTTYGFEAAFQLPGAGSSPEIITKGGDLIGFSSYLFLIPEQNTGVFLTYNQTGALRSLFYPAFINEFFPQYAEAAEFEDYEPQSADELQRYAGLYADLRLSTIVSSVSGAEEQAGKMAIQDAFLGPRVLTQVEENLFVDEISGQFTAFKEHEDGSVYLKEPYLNPMGYERKGVAPAGFRDVSPSSPYVEALYALQSLGYYPNDASTSVNPKHIVTRAEFVEEILKVSNIPASKTSPAEGTDWAQHASAGYIQSALEIGMLGDTKQFKPNQAITRQEAAVMLWRIYQTQYPDELFTEVKLTANTSDWAVPAVKMMIGLGIYGPEVDFHSDGSADFQSKKPLNVQENAAIIYKLLTQPTDQIAAALASEQAQAATSSGDE